MLGARAAQLTTEALRRIAGLYVIEADTRASRPANNDKVRQALAALLRY